MHRVRDVHSVRGFAVIALGLWLMLRQADSVLTRFQSPLGGSYGANDFWAPSPVGLPKQVHTLVDVWRADGNDPAWLQAIWTYTVLDLCFIVAYTALFVVLFDRLARPAETDDRPAFLGHLGRRRLGVVLALAITDVIEDVLRLGLVHRWVSGDWWVYGAWFVTLVKWALLLLVVALVVHAWAAPRMVRAGPRRGSPLAWAVVKLRVAVVLLAVWGLFVIFDPTGQSADIFRRWLDGDLQLLGSAAISLAAAAALGFATWTTTRRAVLAGFAVAPRAPRWWVWLAVAVACAALTLWPHWTHLVGPAVVIGLVFALALGARLVRWFSKDEAFRSADDDRAERLLVTRAGAPTAAQRAEVRRIARGLSTWPVVALLLGIASSWTAPPIILLARGTDDGRAWRAHVGALLAVLLAAGAAYALPKLLRRWETRCWAPGQAGKRRLGKRWPDQLEFRHVAVTGACLLVYIAAVWKPLDVPPAIGAVAVTAIAAALAIIAFGEGQRYGDTHKPPPGLRAIGFTSTPVALLLLVAYAVASLANDGSYHNLTRLGSAAPPADGLDLKMAFDAWKRRACVDQSAPTTNVPMVFVASHGGGIRAAYWTASVLTREFRQADTTSDTCATQPIRRVFAMGGASGGSVGVTAFLGHTDGPRDWYRHTIGEPDYASIPVSWGLLVDVPRTLIGFRTPDRARQFEKAWEEHDDKLKQDFFTSQGTSGPLLVLASTQVETGCRFNVSAIRLTDVSEKDRCTAINGRRSVTRVGSQVVPDAPLTAEVLDYLCGAGSLSRASAALASARFPYVSPSARLSCEDKAHKSKSFTNIVDGGYAENTGAQAVLNLWYRVRPFVDAHNRGKTGARIVPVFLNIDNHYSVAKKANPPKRTQELLTPPLTKLRTYGLDGAGVEQLVEAEFSRPLPGMRTRTCAVNGSPSGSTDRYVRIAPTENPGIPAPLAWTLSKIARDDLDFQLGAAFGTPTAPAVERVLQRGVIRCLS